MANNLPEEKREDKSEGEIQNLLEMDDESNIHNII